MRPLKLTLRGINSYRKEQTIDFEALTSAGLFGIFGPTGSGKSSILDAITLALYARLPRSTKNFININEETAAVSFLFSITTTETHQYQVERSFRITKEIIPPPSAIPALRWRTSPVRSLLFLPTVPQKSPRNVSVFWD